MYTKKAIAGTDSAASAVSAGTGMKTVTLSIPNIVPDLSSSRPRAEETHGISRVGSRNLRPQHRLVHSRLLHLRVPLPQVQHLAWDLEPLGRIHHRVMQVREPGPQGRHLHLQLQARPRVRPQVPGQVSHLSSNADMAVCRPCRLLPMSSSPRLHQSLWIGTQLRHQHLRIGHQSQPCCFHQIGYGIWWGALDGLAHGLGDLHLAS